ncbi:FkbM family methyltransferase [Stella sp.]|uniref:FkbM family methyltransferase n=1 Tax=Stella sp. TaxID=2912054 RepID=UPI0035AD8632
MIRRIRNLFAHPGFRAGPIRMLWRAALWTACVVTRRSPVFRLTAAGERMRVPSDLRYTSVGAFVLRDWSEPELRLLERFLHPGDVFVDVGANVGLYTLKGARIVGPSGRVVAVEPGRDACRVLADNVALNGYRHVTVVPKALADAEAVVTLYHVPLGDDPQAYSLVPGAGQPPGEPVQATTLDRLAEVLRLPRIDCIKIDVEGTEAMVLAGARAQLARWRPTVIFEINCPTGTESGIAPDAAWNLLADLGYRFQRLVDGRLVDLDRFPRDFGNVVARHPASARPDGAATSP